MRKYKRYYIQPDKKDIQTYEYLASDMHSHDDDIAVVEIAALDKALELLKEARQNLYFAGQEYLEESIDAFIAEIEGDK
jgi:formylmethanofuran dehydrogenase subunit B